MKNRAVIPLNVELQPERLISPSAEAVKLLSHEQAKKIRALPIKLHKSRDQVTVAFITADGGAVADIERDMKFVTGFDAKGVIVSEELFRRSLSKAYIEGGVVLAGVVKECPVKPLPSNNLSILASTPALRLLDAILQYAVARCASDIHLIPSADAVRIELRINGEMFRSKESISNSGVYKELLNRLKILAAIDTTKLQPIAEGRFSLTISGVDVNARLSLIATAFGDRATIRMSPGAARTLEELNICSEALKLISLIEDEPSGGVLVSGATGSGKSSLLYGILGRLSSRLSISTIEDPIEVRLPGISQTEAGRGGISYESGFSAVLRHDPDVIMLGEIRTAETARAALQAMLSGHLVLSTLHAGGIYEMLLRLKSFGVSDIDMAEATKLLVNMTLIPRLCECKVLDLEGSNAIGVRLFKKTGCQECDFSGYIGRLPALDILYVDAGVRKALRELTPESIIKVSNQSNSLYKSSQIERYLLAGEVSLKDCHGLIGAF